MPGLSRGRLNEPADAPVSGEAVTELVRLGRVRLEQILSGVLEAPVDYRQEHDEWVVVLRGAAQLTVAEEPVELEAGDWLLLPAGTPHRLVWTQPGTSWLAVHLPPLQET